jgi:adenylate kinase
LSNLIILGPPGSGKGTQAKKLASKLNMAYLATGDLIRDEIARGTELGKKIQPVVESGHLIEANDIAQIISKNIELKKDGGIIFDGFPRTIDQAYILEDCLPGEKFIVINIEVSAESLEKRIEKRWICNDCDKIYIFPESPKASCDACGGKLIKRKDDNPEDLAERVRVYEGETMPLIKYFRDKYEVVDINGEPSIEVVEQEIWDKLEGKIAGN